MTLDSLDLARLQQRTDRLERRLRFFQGLLVAGVVATAAYACAALPRAEAQEVFPTAAGIDPASTGTIRARRIVLEDEHGRERIILGAPIPDPSEGIRISPTVGMMIMDTAGFEPFGLGLQENGRIVMGFDAPPGTGDDRNRERITIVADQHGGAHIRFLDRETKIPARLYLDHENRVWMEFLEFGDTEIVRRRIGFEGEQTLREER
jgi:hypothetical protein